MKVDAEPAATAEPVAEPAVAPSIAGLAEPSRGSSAVRPGGRMTAAQIAVLQRTSGNQAVCRLMRATGAGGSPLQRQPKDGVKSKEGILDDVHIVHYNDAAGFLTSHVRNLETERAALLGDGVGAPADLFNVADAGRQLVSVVQGGGATEIDEVTYDQVDAWYAKYSAAMDAGEIARAQVAADKARAIKVMAIEAQTRIDDMHAKVADKKAAAFRGGDDTLMKALWEWGTNLFDSSLDIKPLIESATAMESELATLARAAAAQAGPNVGKVGTSFKLPGPDKVLPMLELANKVVAGIQAVQAAAELVSAKKSGAAKARSDVKASVQLAGAAETLIGASSGIGIMLNFYIGPMTDACLKALEGLEDLARKINHDLIEQGIYDKVNWDLEAGGRPLFDFMLKVRQAQDETGVPSPAPKEVSAYLVDNEDDLEASAAGGKDDMPMTGHWFWRKTDKDKISGWIFRHRNDLWETFYGSVQPGAKA